MATRDQVRLMQVLAGGELGLEAAAKEAGIPVPRAFAAASEAPNLIQVREDKQTLWSINEQGRQYQRDGLPERRAVAAILAAGGMLAMGELAAAIGPDAKPAIGWLKRKGWATIETGVLRVEAEPPRGPDEEVLASLAEDPSPAEVGDLPARGVVEEHAILARILRLTPDGLAALQSGVAPTEDVTQITPGLIARWPTMSADEKSAVHLRPFDMDAPVEPQYPAMAHPLRQMMEEIRHIFWRMGFTEISGDYVESAYWNMDALFIPQDHPAREEHDTFYLENVEFELSPEEIERAQAVHEHGGDTGSMGWGGKWSSQIAGQGLLRTHTTNTTVRYLADAFKDGPNDSPHRVFGIGRVFRNETMDATHLPEFHQIEGIVTEPGASFDMLVGLARHFFQEMGFEVRFRPAYFPYTEPSMEIDVMWNGKWMELGGSGVFRPEVTDPLGVPHPVLAWGLGLERLAMMRLGLTDIRQLYLPDLDWLQRAG